MKPWSYNLFLFVGAAVFLAGCASRPSKSSVANPPVASGTTAAAPVSANSTPAASTNRTAEVPAGATTQALFLLSVDSQPTGALVLVNGNPLGHAPLRVPVALTAQGFFRDYVSIRVRFVGNSPGEYSGTVEENFTPREKMPGRVVFTPTGAIRKTNQ